MHDRALFSSGTRSCSKLSNRGHDLLKELDRAEVHKGGVVKNKNEFGKVITSVFVGTALFAVVPDVSAQSDALEEVVVTAQKREQRLIDIPGSVQSFDAERLENASIRDVEELLTLVPGASQQSGQAAGRQLFQIRGISQAPSSDPTVGYYIDDSAFNVLTTENTAPMGRAFDVERVEVLRGPQSTLYGNGSMGGTVRFVTKQPSLTDFEGTAQLGFAQVSGGDDNNFADVAVGIPIVEDRLGIRLVASQEDIGGFLEDGFGNSNVDSIDIKNYRANIVFAASDDLEFRLQWLSSEIEQDRGSFIYASGLSISADPGDRSLVEYDTISGTITYELGDTATITSATTLIEYGGVSGTNQNSPFGPLPGSLGFEDSETLSNETRIVSKSDSAFQWMFGMFYSDASNLLDTVFQGFAGAIDEESEALSFFGEASYAFMDGRLIALVGLRHFDDERTANVSFAGTTFTDEGDTFDSVNPRFNLAYSPNEISNYYVNVAKGFRSGRFNSGLGCAAAQLDGFACDISLDSDEVWTYELGTKHSIADNQLYLEVGAYISDWRDYRGAVPVVSIPGQAFFAILGDVEIRGVDLGLRYSPASIDGLDVQATLNWNSSEFASLNPEFAARTGVNNGDRVPYVPEWTGAVTASYQSQLADTWDGLVSLTYSHQTVQPGQFSSGLTGGSQDLLRARIGARNERFGVYLVGTNLLNESSPIAIQNSGLEAFGDPSFFSLINRARPRTVGIELSASF